MNWLRHRNGNGKVYGDDAEVSSDTYLDRDSLICGNSNVYHSHIEGSEIGDSIIVGATVRDSVLFNVRTWGSPLIQSCILRDTVVFDDAKLFGFSLAGLVRIHAGRWDHAPLWDICEGNGLRVGISECTDDRFHLGCWCLPYEIWTRPKYRERIGARAGWTKEMIDLAYQRFTQWRV